MWDRKMVIATFSSIIGVIAMFVAMFQGISLTVRYGSVSLMLICGIVFMWSFLSLGTES